MQRLFSNFANGWPGRGLLTQRIVTGAALVCNAVTSLRSGSTWGEILSEVVAACGGILLVLGLWTPAVGVLVAVVEIWILFSYPGDRWVPLLLATLAATLAMIGPGARSFDAMPFGRKRIQPRSD